MALATTNLSPFTPFSGLPRELRDQIWRDALPGNIGPAFYFYKKGCWQPRWLSKSDEEFDHENDDGNLNFEFCHDLLDDARFEIPLLSVNREARAIALAWVREQGIEIRPGKAPAIGWAFVREQGVEIVPGKEGRNRVFFVRPFDPTHDALYVGQDQWDNFLREPADRLFNPDLLERYVNMKPNLARIAVPEALLRREIATLFEEMFQNYFYLEVLLVVVDGHSDLQPVENDEGVQRRWEFKSTQGKAFLWNRDRGGFISEDWESSDGDEALYTLIEDASKKLGDVLTRNHIRNFEIRPVFAVAR